MKKRFCLLFLILLISTSLYLFANATSAVAASDDHVCSLNTSCGKAATRGNGAMHTVSGCIPPAGEFCGARAVPGYNTSPIYAWDHCRYVTNKISATIFIPFGNTVDWLSFISNVHPTVALLQNCSLPATFAIEPDQSCLTPQFVSSVYSTTATASLGYAPFSTAMPSKESVTAKYHCSAANGTGWFEYETVTYTGLDSEVYTPSWQAAPPVCSMIQPGSTGYPILCEAPVSAAAPSITFTANPMTVSLGSSTVLSWTVTNAAECIASSSNHEADWSGVKSYSGTSSQTVIPTLSPTTTYNLVCTGVGGTTQRSLMIGTTIVGQCGWANGVAVSSAPTLGLCDQGQASFVSGTGPWTWTCAGSTSATTMSCSAPAAGSVGAGTCALNNPVIASFPASGTYSISGSGNSYSLVGNEGTLLVSGFTHAVNISGDNDKLLVSGSKNCVSLNGSHGQIIISGGMQTINLTGRDTSISISGANDTISINLSGGEGITLLISGINNNIMIIGDGYTIAAASGIGNTINGISVN